MHSVSASRWLVPAVPVAPRSGARAVFPIEVPPLQSHRGPGQLREGGLRLVLDF